MRKLSCIIQVSAKHNQMLPYERARGKCNTDPGTGDVTTRPGLEARRQQCLEMAKKWFSPDPPERAQPGRLHFSPIKIISDSWPLQLWENTFLLPQVTKFMLICHSNHRKNKYRHNYTWISHMQTHTHTLMILTSSDEQIHLCACVGHLSWSLQRGNRQTLLCKCCRGDACSGLGAQKAPGLGTNQGNFSGQQGLSVTVRELAVEGG